MRKNIALLKYSINKISDNLVKIYIDSISNYKLLHPIIFADNVTTDIKNIPVFHSFYIDYYNEGLILTNAEDYVVAKNSASDKTRFVVIHNSKDKFSRDSRDIFLPNNDRIHNELQQIIGQ